MRQIFQACMICEFHGCILPTSKHPFEIFFSILGLLDELKLSINKKTSLKLGKFGIFYELKEFD